MNIAHSEFGIYFCVTANMISAANERGMQYGEALKECSDVLQNKHSVTNRSHLTGCPHYNNFSYDGHVVFHTNSD